jgi:hypothetical protein
MQEITVSFFGVSFLAFNSGWSVSLIYLFSLAARARYFADNSWWHAALLCAIQEFP